MLSVWNVENSERALQKTGNSYLCAKSVGDLRGHSRSVRRLTEQGEKGPDCELNRLNEEPEDVRCGAQLPKAMRSHLVLHPVKSIWR